MVVFLKEVILILKHLIPNTRLFFHSEKVGVISLKSNGFTLIEVLIAASILFIVTSIVMPASLLLHQERLIMRDQRMISAMLHDEIQMFIDTDEPNKQFKYEKQAHNKTLQFEFRIKDNFINACVMWTNVKEDEETLCYDAYQK